MTQRPFPLTDALFHDSLMAVTVRCISGLVVEYIVAMDVTRARFPADALVGAGRKAVLRRRPPAGHLPCLRCVPQGCARLAGRRWQLHSAAAVQLASNTSMLSRVARRPFPLTSALFNHLPVTASVHCISGLVVEYIVAIDVTRARFPADACSQLPAGAAASPRHDAAAVAAPSLSPWHLWQRLHDSGQGHGRRVCVGLPPG